MAHKRKKQKKKHLDKWVFHFDINRLQYVYIYV